jgi:hypothetical protein
MAKIEKMQPILYQIVSITSNDIAVGRMQIFALRDILTKNTRKKFASDSSDPNLGTPAFFC